MKGIPLKFGFWHFFRRQRVEYRKQSGQIAAPCFRPGGCSSNAPQNRRLARMDFQKGIPDAFSGIDTTANAVGGIVHLLEFPRQHGQHRQCLQACAGAKWRRRMQQVVKFKIASRDVQDFFIELRQRLLLACGKQGRGIVHEMQRRQAIKLLLIPGADSLIPLLCVKAA